MRILFLTSWYPTSARPYAGVFVREHAKAVRELGNEIVVLHLAGRGETGRRLWRLEEERDPDLTEGIPTFHLWHRSMPVRGASYPIHLWAVVRAFGRMRRTFAPDVLHANVFEAGVPAVLLGRLTGLPVVITEHSTAFPQHALSTTARWKARFAFGRADRVMPVCDFLRRAIAETGIDAAFEVVPNTVDTSLFFPRADDRPATGRPEAAPHRLLFVGNLDHSPHKGFEDLLEALAGLAHRRSDWRLDVVGDGPARADRERRTADLGLSPRVVYHGSMPKPGVARLMRGADLLVLPSHFENLPCVVIEAIASGLPVVATPVGGVPEMVTEANGILVPPGDPPALEAALDRAISGLGSFDRVAIAADARSRFSLAAVGARLQAIYDSVAPAAVRRREGERRGMAVPEPGESVARS